MHRYLVLHVRGSNHAVQYGNFLNKLRFSKLLGFNVVQMVTDQVRLGLPVHGAWSLLTNSLDQICICRAIHRNAGV